MYTVTQAHPEWEITCCVRNSEKGAKVVAAFPNVKLVYGDLDAAEILEEAAAQADIVYHFADCDHEPSARAIAKGLARRQSDKPGFWIHTSGTLILGNQTISSAEYGRRLDKVYDDCDHINELTSQPDQAPHRNVDKIVLASASDKVKVAIVCPPTIYGPGRGPDNQRSAQIPIAIDTFLKNQKAFKVGKGENIWHSIHVQDLSTLYLLLGEAAANGGPPATWNDQGYYLAENGSFVWGDIIQLIADIAYKKKLLPQPTVESYAPDEVDKYVSHGRYLFGTDSRGISIRGKRLLGWKPTMPSVEEVVPATVDVEAKTLGLV